VAAVMILWTSPGPLFFRQIRTGYLGKPFELFKLARRFPSKPYVLGSFVRLYGFLWGYCIREERPVSREFMQFLRSEQKNALRKLFRLGPAKRTLPKSIARRAEPVCTDEVPGGKPPAGHNA